MYQNRILSLSLLTLTFACTAGDKDEDSSSPPDIITDSGGSGGDDCEGTAPVIDEIRCENTGIQPHYETGEDTVTMAIWTDVSDLDGDLTSYALQIFFDDEIDDEVDTSVTNFSPVYGTVDADECAADDASLGLTLFLTGNDPDYATLYDWGVVVTDAFGLASEPAIISCWTPESDGTDGGVE